MKKLLLPFLLLTTTASAQVYGTSHLGLAFGQAYNGVNKTNHSFGPQAFTFSMGAGWQSGYHHGMTIAENTPAESLRKPHLLIETQAMYLAAPTLTASIGLKMRFFELLAGYGDILLYQTHPLTIHHYFTPQGTVRLVFGDFAGTVQYLDHSVIFAAGVKYFIGR